MSFDTQRSEYHDNLIKYSEDAYKKNFSYPKRYCYILTNLCNLSCSFCFQDRKKQEGAMTTADWLKLTDQLPEHSRVTLTGGEPLVFKGFKEIFDKVANKFECNIITNGILLTKEIIDFILSYKNFKVLSISIDNINNTIRGVKSHKWKHTEEMLKYFLETKVHLNLKCILDTKTTILDENAEELFDIHKYCTEKLNADTHAFQFLKGSPIQHSDIMFDLNDIYKKSEAYQYKKWDLIVDQLKKIKEYNFKNKKDCFLHPPVASMIDSNSLDHINYINDLNHNKYNYKSCSAPWASVHINVDGTLFPCLAINMGNVKNGLDSVILGKKFKDFKDIIKKEGTVEACNRCGWLQPSK